MTKTAAPATSEPRKPATTEIHVLCEEPVGQVSTIRDSRAVRWTKEKPVRRLPADSALDLVRLGVGFALLFTVQALAKRYGVPPKVVDALIAAGKARVVEHKDADAPEDEKPQTFVVLTHEVARALGAGLKAKAKRELQELRDALKAKAQAKPAAN